jgi:phosphatidylserine decarboxylase
MKNNLLPIAKEGWSYIVGATLLFVLFIFLDLGFLQFFAFLAIIFFIFLFRNPERQHVYYEKNSVVSPVDGVTVSIEELKDDEYAYKIKIDSSYLNVSLLRTPFNSSLKHVSKLNGARLSPLNSLSKSINENSELIFMDENSNTAKISHRVKQSFMGIKIEAIESQNLNQGSRYGVMVNGITTLYLPQSFRLNISVGSELVASETLIGYFTTAID